MYCGNNRRNLDIQSGAKVIGTRYQCFRKGVGVGLSLPVDPEYTRRFSPIDKRKVYCGKNRRMPDEYDILGKNDMCFRKGVGVGKSIKAKKK